MKNTPQHGSAFTLVELLVVVAIIVALIAILLPSMSRAISISQATVCASNQRQLSLAFLSYAAENKRQLFGVSHVGNQYWFHRLSRHLGIPQFEQDPVKYREGALKVMHCPSSTERDPSTSGMGHAGFDWAFENGTGSYGMNLWYTPGGLYYGDPAVGSTANFFQSYTDVKQTSTTPVFADSLWVGSWPSENDIPATNLQYGDAAHTFGHFMGRFTIDRHDRAISVAMHDGSAGRYDLADLWTLTWHKNYTPNHSVTFP